MGIENGPSTSESGTSTSAGGASTCGDDVSASGGSALGTGDDPLTSGGSASSGGDGVSASGDGVSASGSVASTSGSDDVILVVKTIDTGDDFIINTFPSDTILDVKKKIRNQKGYFLRQQELAVAGVRGEVLEDDRTLRDYSIRSWSHVFLYFRPG